MKKVKIVFITKYQTLFILALFFRLSLIFVAYHGDINNNTSWAKNAVRFGLKDFYERKEWEFSRPNQPPGTIYFLWLAGKIYQTVKDGSWWLNLNFRFFPSPFVWWWEANGLWGLVKIPGILADLGIGWLIYDFAKKIKRQWALGLAALYLFNPVSWYNSAFWGQTDALVNFFGLIGVMSLIGRRMIKAVVFLAFSLFIKASLLPLLPVFIMVGWWQGKRKELFLGSLGILGILGIFCLPFHPKADVFLWLVELYRQRILSGETGTLTVNAFNFWAMLEGKKMVLDNLLFLGMEARVWGFLVFLFMLFGLLRLLKKELSAERIIFALALAAFGPFLFLTRMHERYLFPFFPLATLLLIFYPRLIGFYLPLSLIHWLNLYSEWWQPYSGWLKRFLLSELAVRGISFFHLLLFLTLFFIFIFNGQWLKKKFWRSA